MRVPAGRLAGDPLGFAGRGRNLSIERHAGLHYDEGPARSHPMRIDDVEAPRLPRAAASDFDVQPGGFQFADASSAHQRIGVNLSDDDPADAGVGYGTVVTVKSTLDGNRAALIEITPPTAG